jgi:hypothetical protein
MVHANIPEFDCPLETIPNHESVQDEFVQTEIDRFEVRQERHSLEQSLHQHRYPCVRDVLSNNSRFCRPTDRPNKILVSHTPAFKHTEVTYVPEKNRFCGEAEFGAMKCHYECEPKELNDYLEACDTYSQQHDCRKTFPQPGYRVQHPDLDPYDKINCPLDKDYMTEILNHCPPVESVTDEVLASLEAKLLCLKTEEKIHNAGLTPLEKIALYSIAGVGTLVAGAAGLGGAAVGTGVGVLSGVNIGSAALLGAGIGVGGVLLPVAAATGIVYGVGAVIRKIRSEKARRSKLGLDRKELRRLRKVERKDKRYGQEDFRITSLEELPADVEAAIADKDTFDVFMKCHIENLKDFRQDFIAQYGRKSWRKWKQYVRTKNTEEQKIIDAKARTEIAKTKHSRRDRKKYLNDN